MINHPDPDNIENIDKDCRRKRWYNKRKRSFVKWSDFEEAAKKRREQFEKENQREYERKRK